MTVDALRKASPELAVEGKHLQLPLMAAERAWAYAMQLKFEMNSEPRKKYHMQNRLRKARHHAEQLVQLVMAEGAPVSLIHISAYKLEPISKMPYSAIYLLIFPKIFFRLMQELN